MTINNNFIFDCNSCLTKCDGKSKLNYQFMSDVEFAENEEEIIRTKISLKESYIANKCELDGYPDIEVFLNGKLHRYLEVKAQRRTFMSVERILPNSNLKPSETLALNLSDLLRYFKIEKETGIQTSIVWVLMNRNCIVKDQQKRYFYQTTKRLKQIYLNNKEERRFRRKSGKGDVVDGVHKGVTVNYHFSLNELREWNV